MDIMRPEKVIVEIPGEVGLSGCQEKCIERSTIGGTMKRLNQILTASMVAAAATVFCVALLTPRSIIAQVQNGTITGRVTDPTGAVVAGAVVTVTQPGTGLVMHGETNGDGTYIFSQLQPAQYRVLVEKEGFKKAGASFTLTVGQVAQIDVSLPVGNQTETVNVEAESSAQMDTQTSNLDYTVQARQVDDLPLNGRNPYGLAVLSPGILPGGSFGVGVAVARGAVVAAATNNFQSNGGIGGSNEVLLDVVSIVVCCQGQPAVTPSVEVVSQFKVVTSDPPAEYGRTSGAVLNIATKSGTNSLHGDVYDFMRNDKLDAANFFTKRSAVYPYPGHSDFRPPHRENQFGVFAGGPVMLPHVYHGRDKTFFAFGFEGVRNLAPAVGLTTVPTALMRQGIFTEGPSMVYDPNSYNASTGQRSPLTAATCNGTAFAAGYCIPAFNPVAKALLPFMPPPNLSGTVNNYSYVQTQVDSDNQFNFRIDHNFSDKQRTFIRGTRATNSHLVYDLFNKTTGLNSTLQDLTAYLFALGHVWTISPNTIVQFSYGFARQTNNGSAPSQEVDPTPFGFSSTYASELEVTSLPALAFTGLVSLGGVNGINHWAHNSQLLNASALLQRSKHNIAIGYSGRFTQENQLGLAGGAVGSFTFNTQFTGGPSPNSSLPSGQNAFDAWASFLLGYPGAGIVSRQYTISFNQWVSALYLQDDWRITPKLTLNIGLRWDVETGFAERHNHWADFNPSVTSPLSSAVGFNIQGGAQFLGYNGNPSRTSPTYYHEVGPRIGFSYAVNEKTVARGGYGILYLPTSERGYSDPNIGFTQTTNIATSANGFTPAVTIDNPFPTGVLLPAGPVAGVGVGAGSAISGFEYNNPVSYQQQWSFGIERGLAKGMTLNVNYAGGHGVDLPLSVRLNDLNPAYYGSVGSSAQVSYLQAQVPNPFFGATGIAPGSPLLNPTVQRVQLLNAFPQYSAGTISSIQNSSLGIAYLDHGSATYNSLQATWLVNHHGGLTGSVSYVWSKLLGDVSDLTNGFLNPTGNPGIQSFYFLHSNEHSNLATDVPQRVVGTASYPLPFGRGKAFGTSMPGWANEVAGGWTLTTIIDVYSGFPLGMGVAGASAFAGTRPMYVSGVAPLTSGSTHQRLGGAGQTQSYLNPAAFTRPQSFQLGNVPRSAAALRGPLSFDDNLSVIKLFPIREELALEFRAEAFNVLNKVDFGLPTATVGGSGFGNITSQYNLPRNVQVALKLHF
jgi:hypothetical protein